MINFQRLAFSMILIVLSLVQINALVRQNPNCPSVNLCDFSPCANGQCVEDRTIEECFRCTCPTDFTGERCETPIVTPSGCNPPCLNGGQCLQNASNVFSCVCSTNFTGIQCETSVIAIHPCVATPGTVCQNGGTCTMNGSGFLCNCPTGFGGVNCEIQTTMPTTCAANTCGTHGNCRQFVTQGGEPIAICICDSQWTGNFCETNLAANCSVGFCQAGGTCVMSGTGPYCLCPSTHVGQQCEIPISPLTTTTAMTTTTATGITFTTSTATLTPISGGCTPNPCSNGGSCYTTGNSFICVCRPQFTGSTCSLQAPVTTPALTTTAGVSPCATNPCLNGGSCFRYGNSFVCVCTTQYVGLTCDTVKSTTIPSVTTPSSTITCANQPCLNGATCYNAGTSYFCYCGSNSNFVGKNCDTPKVTFDANCPLDCSPGHCVRAGHGIHAHACMCNGTLTPESCRSK
jgi:hypothetical protein